MNFGKLLREIREKNGDSLRRLGDKSEVKFTYLARIEKGELEPSKTVLKGLFNVYPTYKKSLAKAFIEEKIPKFVWNELENNDITEDYLDRILIILQMLDVEEQKSILTNIVERVEYNALKKGTAGEIKDLLDEIREKIEEL